MKTATVKERTPATRAQGRSTRQSIHRHLTACTSKTPRRLEMQRFRMKYIAILAAGILSMAGRLETTLHAQPNGTAPSNAAIKPSGTYFTFDPPGSIATYVAGIN